MTPEEARGEEPAFLDVGRGKVLLLLRGEDSSERIWASFAPLFAEAMRVIVATAPSLTANEAETMLLDARVERFAILAHGAAGPVAVELAARKDCDALVLIGAVTSETARHAGDAERRVAEREIPIFLLWGEDDAVVPAEEGERLSERLPTSTLALVPGAGHDVAESAAATVVPLVFEYLRSRYLGERHGHAEAGGPVPVALTRRPDQT
ncbi:MAG: alpha/beta fold hydrolase [Actinomycetota bacterium]